VRRIRVVAGAGCLAACLGACGAGESSPAPSAARLEHVLRLAPRLAGTRVEEPGPAPPRATHANLQGTTLRSIFLHPDSTLVFPDLPILDRTTLEFSIGIEDAALAKGSDGARFEVWLGAPGRREKVYDRLLDPMRREADRGWVRAEVSLAPWAGQTVDLAFRTARGPAGDASFDWAHWGDPRLRAEIVTSEETDRPNLLLVSFDTLRADYLGTYGFPLDTSPHVDALARRGAAFDAMIAQAPWTLPSHFSLLTGLYPDRRLLRYDLHPCTIRGDVTMLAEDLEQAGYLTAAFTGGGYVSAALGFDQGFHVFESHGTRLEDNLPAVLEWLGQHARSRFFLFLHHFNVHRPYDPPPEVLKRFVHEVPEPCAGVVFREEDTTSGRRNACLAHPQGLDYLRGVYAAEVAHADFLFGRVLEALEREGVLERTLVVATSDHGEELMDHGSLDHVKTLYQEVVRTPLVVAGPGVAPGVRIPELIEGVDLRPTLLALLGVRAAAEGDGESLAPLLACAGDRRSPRCLAQAARRTALPDPRRAFTATAFDRSLPKLRAETDEFKAAVLGGGSKLVALGAEPEELLFDLARDPGELAPLSRAGSGGEALRESLTRWLEAIPDDVFCEASQVSPATRDQLEALGYLK
jgi:arylsulfatase A-like enzyme